MRRNIWQYLFNIAVSLDQLLNTILGGDPDETLSRRTARARKTRPSNIALAIFTYGVNIMFLLLGETDHIKKSLQKKTGAKEVWDWTKNE